MTCFKPLAFGLLAVFGVGCGNSADSGAGTLDGPVMRYPESAPREGEDAEVRGRLDRDGDCLYLAVDEIDERFPIVWPARTSWDPEAESVISPVGDRMPIGSHVQGGGGYHDIEDVGRRLGSDAQALATRCVENPFTQVAFVSNADEAIGPAE